MQYQIRGSNCTWYIWFKPPAHLEWSRLYTYHFYSKRQAEETIQALVGLQREEVYTYDQYGNILVGSHK